MSDKTRKAIAARIAKKAGQQAAAAIKDKDLSVTVKAEPKVTVEDKPA